MSPIPGPPAGYAHSYPVANADDLDAYIGLAATTFVSKSQLALFPEAFGAVGDGVANDDAAFALLMVQFNSATGIPRIILGPNKTYKLTAPLNFTRSGGIIEGFGVTSRIINAVSDVFTFGAGSAASKHVFQNFRATASAGHIFNVTNGAFYQNAMINVTLDQSNANFGIYNQTSGDFLDNYFIGLDISGTTGHTVPLWKVLSATGGANTNLWVKGRSTFSGNYVFWIEDTTTFSNDNTWRDWNFETPNGGCIMGKSANGWQIKNCGVYDLSLFNGGVTLNDLFVITKSTGPSSRYNEFDHVIRHGGTLGASLNDIKLGAASAPLTVFRQCDLSSGSAGYTIDLGANSAISLYDMGGLVTVNNRGAQVVQSNGSTFGIFGATPIAKPTVSGAKGGNAALTSLLTQLAALGLITDSTT